LILIEDQKILNGIDESLDDQAVDLRIGHEIFDEFFEVQEVSPSFHERLKYVG
jgi:hypothetical protein